MMKKKKCSFDNIIQRSYVWEKARKSDLIHSLIEDYPVPPFYARRVEGVYDFLDGKQRMNAIAGYINEDYELTALPPVSYEPDDGDELVEIDITGKKFGELPEELQDLILSYPLTIYYYDEITDAQVATLFRKLNNGKPLSTKDRNIANCIDIFNISKIGGHPFFNEILTEKGLRNRKQLPIIMKMWCMLYQEKISFESSKFNKIVQEMAITEEQRQVLNSVLNRMGDMYDEIPNIEYEKEKVRLLRKKLSFETHLVSFTPFVKKAIDENINTTMLTEFFAYFYGTKDSTTISDIYNNTVNSGSAKAVNISRRNHELEKAWDDFFKEDLEGAATEKTGETVKAKITTQQLFDMFFEDRTAKKGEENVKKTRSQIDRQEVYDYEKKIGKQLIEMDVDELFGMVKTFNRNGDSTSPGLGISYNSYNQIAYMYRALWDFYIDNVEVIQNPWNSYKMSGRQASEILLMDREPFSVEFVENIITQIRDDFDEPHANYYECILRLYLEGFSKAEEIVLLDKDMIQDGKAIKLPRCTVKLSDRCYELLEFVNKLDIMPGWRGDYIMVQWHGYYFKYIIRPSNIDSFQKRTMRDVANLINRAVSVNVKEKYGADIGYRALYILGFYESLRKQFGTKRTKELILSERNSNDTEELMDAAGKYGYITDSVSYLKRDLRICI